MEGAEKKAQGSRRTDRPTEIEYKSSSAGSQEIIASSRISLRLWRLYAYFWLVCLFFPIFYLVRTPLAAIPLLVALAGLAIFTTSYLWIMWPHPLSTGAHARYRFRNSLILPIVLSVLVLFLSLMYGNAFLWLFVGVSALVGVMLPPCRAFWAIMVLTLLTLGVSVGASGGIALTDWLQVIPLVLLVRGLGLDMAGLIRLSDALSELYAAREELARQAVVEERLRLARDLHDLLGHTLSMITLKSELAGRLIEKEPVMAAQEIHDVERVARQALREVREAVAGYRQQTLQGELESARQILEAAGIAYMVEHTTKELPPGIDAVLAWVVREGVTNVIRHSRARQCLIQITCQDGIVRAELTNDGYAGQKGSTSGAGSGITGLAERVAAHGGHFEAGLHSIESGQEFRLLVELPIQSSAIAEVK